MNANQLQTEDDAQNSMAPEAFSFPTMSNTTTAESSSAAASLQTTTPRPPLATTTTTAAAPIAPAPPSSNSQTNYFWQQALQTLNFLPAAQQAAQQPYLPVVAAAGGASLAALNQQLGALLPQAGQQQASLNTATGIPTPLAPAFAANPGFMTTNNNYSQVATNAIAAPPSHNKRKETSSSTDTQGRIKFSRPMGTPSVVSSSQSSASDACFSQAPPKKLSEADLNRLPPAERRRYERNLREQQRSYRISQQIKQLRDVLAASNIPFKPNKFSILVSVADYIQELQARAIMLDADHTRLVDTIRQTNELVSSGQVPSSSSSSEESNSGDNLGESSNNNHSGTNLSSNALSSAECSPDALLVQGIDYQGVFRHCPYPLGVASLDGRILACNPSFERTMTGETGKNMVQQSLFLYIRNHQEIFEAMADLLKRSSAASETGADEVTNRSLLYWCGQVVSSQQQELGINITLTGLPDGSPKFFCFSIATSA